MIAILLFIVCSLLWYIPVYKKQGKSTTRLMTILFANTVKKGALDMANVRLVMTSISLLQGTQSASHFLRFPG